MDREPQTGKPRLRQSGMSDFRGRCWPLKVYKCLELCLEVLSAVLLGSAVGFGGPCQQVGSGKMVAPKNKRSNEVFCKRAEATRFSLIVHSDLDLDFWGRASLVVGIAAVSI